MLKKSGILLLGFALTMSSLNTYAESDLDFDLTMGKIEAAAANNLEYRIRLNVVNLDLIVGTSNSAMLIEADRMALRKRFLALLEESKTLDLSLSENHKQFYERLEEIELEAAQLMRFAHPFLDKNDTEGEFAD